jgi:hypothetical protein
VCPEFHTVGVDETTTVAWKLGRRGWRSISDFALGAGVLEVNQSCRLNEIEQIRGREDDESGTSNAPRCL